MKNELAKDTFPLPTKEELHHTENMARFLVEYIQKKGGQISFADYFEQVLYHKDYGYYTGKLPIFGEEGDFITAPLVSPYFSYALANQIIEIAHLLEEALFSTYDILEIGAGTGVMAADILYQLKRQNKLPRHYYILERSFTMREQQKSLLLSQHPDIFERIHWLDAPLEQAWQGVILANEVVDALPVERFRLKDGISYYVDVGLAVDEKAQSLSIEPVLRQGDYKLHSFIKDLARYGVILPKDYESEYCAILESWLPSVCKSLTQGAALFIDYGYDEAEYYRPERDSGTLIAHYKHRAHEDFYLYPGLQDLTANVNFTQLAMIGQNAGLDLLGYTTQNFFLYGNKLEGLLKEAQDEFQNDPEGEVAWYKISQGIQQLVLPDTMGERFRVMALGRNLDADLQGFSLADYSYQL